MPATFRISPLCLCVILVLLGKVSGQSIDPPAGWRKAEQAPKGLLFQYLDSQAKAGFSANLIGTRGKMPCCKEDSTPVDSLAAKVIGQQGRILPQFRVVEKVERKVAGHSGAFVVSTYAHGQQDLACLQFFYLDGSDFVNIVYTIPSSAVGALRPAIEKSLLTLHHADDGEPRAN